MSPFILLGAPLRVGLCVATLTLRCDSTLRFDPQCASHTTTIPCALFQSLVFFVADFFKPFVAGALAARLKGDVAEP